jgi:UDP-GlcNAc:undecaprenyl-phosphate/decaprenyl-phosphate GlcNAc-1-phosphate transferase
MNGIIAQVTGAPFTADQVLSPYIYVFYVSFIVAFIFTPVMRTVATYYGIIDQPDQIRKMHTEPVAYLGGVAVFLGWIAGLAISQFLRLHYQELGWPPHLVVKFSIVMGACIIVVLGLWDDVLGLSPLVKIGGQIFAALFLLIDGIGTRAIEPFLAPLGQRLQIWMGADPTIPFFSEWFIIATSSILVILVVVGCCNAANLMDGLDGLCGGVTAIIAAGFLFLAIHLAMFGGGLNTNWDGLRIVIALALLGAVLGFIPYNFNPASIFMGDTGSMFLGFACAVMIVLMVQAGSHPKWFLAAMVIFALPVLDTILAFARRWVNRRPLFSPDKLHFHHQLVSRGLSVKKTVMISYGLAIGFALLGAAIVYMRTRYAVAFYLVIFGSIIVAAYKMGMVHERPKVVPRRHLGSDEDAARPEAAEPTAVLEIEDPERPAVGEPLAGTWADKG